MVHLLVVAVGALALPSPHSVLLQPSGTAVVHFAVDQQHWSIERSEAEPVLSGIGNKAAVLQSEPEAAKTEQLTAVPVDPSTIVSGEIKMSFVRLPGRPGVMLYVANGYPRRLASQAVLRRGDAQRPTTVCSVAGNVYGIETWPYDVDAIALSGFVLLDVNTSDPGCG